MTNNYRWRVFYEVGACCGHRDPSAFADFMLSPPCDHLVSWDWDDDEVCPAPCDRKHWWCSACSRPMYPTCPIVEEEDQ